MSKKITWLALATIAMMSACSQDENVEMIQPTSKNTEPIEFSVYATGKTRVEAITDANIKDQTINFCAHSKNTEWNVHDEIKWVDDGFGWATRHADNTYKELLWPAGETSLDFYACTYNGSGTMSLGAGVDCREISYTNPSTLSEQGDLLIGATTAVSSEKKVNFTLNHALSLVHFIWKSSGDYADGIQYKLEELTILDSKTQGQISYNGLVPSWNNLNTQKNIEVYSNNSEVYENPNMSDSIMIVPNQSLKLAVKYSTWQNGGITKKMDKPLTIDIDTILEMGKKYSFKLIPTSAERGDRITFFVSVNYWQSATNSGETQDVPL